LLISHVEVNLMSILKLFGKAQAAPKEQFNPQATLERLRDAQTTMEKREEYLEKRISQEVTAAKDHARKLKKAEALKCLKRKRMYEAQQQTLAGARVTLDAQILAIEGHSATFAAFTAMREGAQTMKGLNNNMNVEDVDEMMDDIREAMDDAKEVGDALSRPVGLDGLDDEDLEKELVELQREQEREQGLLQQREHEKEQLRPAGLDDLASMPSVPRGAPAAATRSKDDDEFAALEREMGLQS